MPVSEQGLGLEWELVPLQGLGPTLVLELMLVSEQGSGATLEPASLQGLGQVLVMNSVQALVAKAVLVFEQG